MNDLLLSLSALWRLYRSQILTLAIFSAIAGAGYFAWHSLASPKARAIAIVKRSLVDPDSAIFENVTYSSQSGLIHGSVNAKNRMGGYAGMRRFTVSGDGSVTFH